MTVGWLPAVDESLLREDERAMAVTDAQRARIEACDDVATLGLPPNYPKIGTATRVPPRGSP